MDFSKQSRLFNPEENNLRLDITGIGSIGSWLTLNAAKTGISISKVRDFDIVEEGNIAAQAFGLEDVGKTKVKALIEKVKRETGIVVEGEEVKVDEDYVLIPEADVIYCGLVDDLQSRKMLFDKIKKFPVMWLDTRIGGFNWRYYFIDTSNKKLVKEYEKTFEEETIDETCGEKCCNPINQMVVSSVIRNLFRISKGEKYITKAIGHAMNPDNVFRVWSK